MGQLDPDGTFTPCGSSNVGKAVNDDLVVVWDGSKPDPMPNGSTKGRLLPVKGPRYIDSLVAIGFYKRAAQDAEQVEIDETAQGPKRFITGPTQGNCIFRKRKAT
jgi:hypothetical protein